MKIAHLILTHKNPKQLERLIGNLQHPGFDFYIHIDKKADIQPFMQIQWAENVFFIRNRTSIEWASYGTIQATINGFQEILPMQKYAYINVISGQDFVLKSASYIYDYFVTNRGNEFITCESIKNEWKEAAPRVEKYHLINYRIPGKYRLEKILNLVLPKRKFPFDFEIVGRANWFALTAPACDYILDFINKNPSIVKYFWLCWGADEFMFSTILFNSHFKPAIQNNLTYVDWSGPKTGHPTIFTKDFYPQLVASDKLFARKFDMDIDKDIFDMLEQHIQLASGNAVGQNKPIAS